MVVHCGTSTFPGALNAVGDPVLIEERAARLPPAATGAGAGGRGWWYDAAAFLALSDERVWIELSGLPPSRLRTYYARHDWARLTRRMIFATDWPAVPGIARTPGRWPRSARTRDRRPGAGRQRGPGLPAAAGLSDRCGRAVAG